MRAGSAADGSYVTVARPRARLTEAPLTPGTVRAVLQAVDSDLASPGGERLKSLSSFPVDAVGR